MDDGLEQIRMTLRQGLNLSQQGSYQRRAPAHRAVPLLEKARHELIAWINEQGESTESLRLLALAEEALLNYDSAVLLLEKVIAQASKPDRKDIRRLAACRKARQEWRKLMLNPSELEALGCFLRDKLLDTAPEKSFRWTESWLDENKPSWRSKIVQSIQNLGYYSDYEVLHNLVPG